MSLDKRTRERLRALCGELNEDDGVDPRRYFKERGSRNKANRKTLQLCRQVADVLGLVLAGEFADELLHNLQVVSVEPAPDATQLSITLGSEWAGTPAEAEQILNRVNAVAGILRCSVAAAITRKRAPKLLFRVVAANSERLVHDDREVRK